MEEYLSLHRSNSSCVFHVDASIWPFNATQPLEFRLAHSGNVFRSPVSRNTPQSTNTAFRDPTRRLRNSRANKLTEYLERKILHVRHLQEVRSCCCVTLDLSTAAPSLRRFQCCTVAHRHPRAAAAVPSQPRHVRQTGNPTREMKRSPSQTTQFGSLERIRPHCESLICARSCRVWAVQCGIRFLRIIPLTRPPTPASIPRCP